jgi:hypothetical protein
MLNCKKTHIHINLLAKPCLERIERSGLLCDPNKKRIRTFYSWHISNKYPIIKTPIQVGHAIDRPEFEQAFGKLYNPGQAQLIKPTRLMVGLHYLKHAYDLSDEDVIAR